MIRNVCLVICIRHFVRKRLFIRLRLFIKVCSLFRMRYLYVNVCRYVYSKTFVCKRLFVYWKTFVPKRLSVHTKTFVRKYFFDYTKTCIPLFANVRFFFFHLHTLFVRKRFFVHTETSARLRLPSSVNSFVNYSFIRKR